MPYSKRYRGSWRPEELRQRKPEAPGFLVEACQRRLRGFAEPSGRRAENPPIWSIDAAANPASTLDTTLDKMAVANENHRPPVAPMAIESPSQLPCAPRWSASTTTLHCQSRQPVATWRASRLRSRGHSIFRNGTSQVCSNQRCDRTRCSGISIRRSRTEFDSRRSPGGIAGAPRRVRH